MSENRPEHQHFIPRTYLKKFGDKVDKKKCFVECKQRESDQILPSVSIRDICVQSNLYTIPSEELDKRYVLENHYAKNVDGAFNEVYDILVDERIAKVSSSQKQKILYTLLSFYFRTPKFLNSVSREDEMIIDASLAFADKSGKTQITWESGEVSRFNIADLEEIKRARRESNRIRFIKGHLETWHRFVYKKLHGNISVFKVHGNVPLITSDNPVHIKSTAFEPFDLFSPHNFIQLPLNPEHLLWIAPRSIVSDLNALNSIYRQDRDETFAITSNLTVEAECERWIFGKKGTVQQHTKDQHKYNNDKEFGAAVLAGWEIKHREMSKLWILMDRHGLASDQVIGQLKYMKTLPEFESPFELKFLTDELRRIGIDIE